MRYSIWLKLDVSGACFLLISLFGNWTTIPLMILVDKSVFLLAATVTIAYVHDSKAAYRLARYLR